MIDADRLDTKAIEPCVHLVRELPSPGATQSTTRLAPLDLTDAARLHDVLARDLGLPDYYGRNFDALFDVLTDPAVVGERQITIVIENASRAFEIGSNLLAPLLTVVQTAAARWTRPNVVSVVFVEAPIAEPALLDHDAFATEWVAGWNAKDIERVLLHYADHVVLTSPVAARVVPESHGTIHGKAALRAYWQLAVARSGALHFTLEETLSSVGALTILYRNHRDERVTETLLFDRAGLVTRAFVAYR